MPPSSGVPQPHPPLKTSKTSPTASTPGAMPPSSGVPQPHPPLKTSKTSPTCIHSRSNVTFLWRPSSILLLTKPQKHPRLHPPSDATFLWRPSTTSIHTKKSPASSYSKDTELPSVIYKLEMRLELTTPSLRVKCSTD